MTLEQFPLLYPTSHRPEKLYDEETIGRKKASSTFSGSAPAQQIARIEIQSSSQMHSPCQANGGDINASGHDNGHAGPVLLVAPPISLRYGKANFFSRNL
jgi:hypothetical protein